MNKNTIHPKHTTHDPKLNIYFLKDLQEKTLIFNRLEQPIFNYQPLIVAETGKHYYYLGFSHDERIVTDHICCMEKSVMKKFVDVEKAKRIKNLNSNEQSVVIEELIKHLSFVSPKIITKTIWLVTTLIEQESLPHCSILEVNYDEKQECFLPDLVFCHPKIWDSNKSDWEKTKLDYNFKNEVARITDKFGFHLQKSVKDPLNSVLIRLQADLEAIIFYLTYLKQELEPKNKIKLHPPAELKSFYFRDLQEKTLIFDRFEQPIFNHQPLIVAKTEKHYYYLSCSNDEESNKKIVTDHICCMEKSVMEKFIDIEKAKKLKNFNSDKKSVVIEELIKHLSFIKPNENMGPVWIVAALLNPDSLPHCSILEVNYDEKQECFLPDLVFCHPKIWHLWIKSESKKTWLKYNIKNEMKRIAKKFEIHFHNSTNDPLNSAWFRLGVDFESIILYLKHLKKRT